MSTILGSLCFLFVCTNDTIAPGLGFAFQKIKEEKQVRKKMQLGEKHLERSQLPGHPFDIPALSLCANFLPSLGSFC